VHDGEAPGRRRLTRAEAKEQTRQRLLDSAARVFADKGFAGASLEEISEAAGYSTGALYSNFQGKEELFLDLLRTRWSRAIARRAEVVAKALDDEVAGGADLFDALSRFAVQLSERDREFAALGAELWLYAIRNPEAMGLVAAMLGEQVARLEPVIAAAMERYGWAAQMTPKELTTVAVILFDGLIRQRRIDASAVPDDLFARALRSLFGGPATP
jgi:AcrR family transcriptional regulator